jgi:NADH-quinone oxidoreductase subunit J
MNGIGESPGNHVPQTIADILFAVSAVLAVLLSLTVVLARNPVRSTLLLILSFVPISLIYVLMRASFVGILQILVYAGAIMMLFTFVIMMINPAPHGGELPEENTGLPARRTLRKGNLAWALLLAAFGLIVIPPLRAAAAAIAARVAPAAIRDDFGGVHAMARLIFNDPANNPLTVSFELISALILVGVIAAINFGRSRTKDEKDGAP